MSSRQNIGNKGFVFKTFRNKELTKSVDFRPHSTVFGSGFTIAIRLKFNYYPLASGAGAASRSVAWNRHSSALLRVMRDCRAPGGWEVCDGAHGSVVTIECSVSAHQTHRLHDHLIRVRIVPQWKESRASVIFPAKPPVPHGLSLLPPWLESCRRRWLVWGRCGA